MDERKNLLPMITIDKVTISALGIELHQTRIVIFRYPDDESQLFIKRIIGLPGETVEIIDGKIYIDGSSQPLQDVNTKETPLGSFGPFKVPENCYFVMGDNRNNSLDSRYWKNTYVRRDEILGKAIFRYWPLDTIRLLR